MKAASGFLAGFYMAITTLASPAAYAAQLFAARGTDSVLRAYPAVYEEHPGNKIAAGENNDNGATAQDGDVVRQWKRPIRLKGRTLSRTTDTYAASVAAPRVK